MNDWQIVLLHTEKETLLKRAFETAFPDRTLSLHVPELGKERKSWRVYKPDLVDYFNRQVHDPGVWSRRILTVYGNGEYHHYTYALTRLACARRGLHSWDWTYFQCDNHRDDWGKRRESGEAYKLDCASFVDSIAHDHRGIPFFIGPDVYAKKDSRGYKINGQHIPIYHNQFPKSLQESRVWTGNKQVWQTDTRKLPAHRDLKETPAESYLSFDLDLLPYTEIVTNYDQSALMTLRDLLRIVDRIREHKRVFSADILGFPDHCHHPLSALTMIILAKRLMGQSVRQLLEYHTWFKRRQAGQRVNLLDIDRESPFNEGVLMEILK